MNLSEIDVVILCGGRGERLRSVMGRRPKVLADIEGRPFILRLMDHLATRGFRRVILCTGIGHGQIAKACREAEPAPNVHIVFSRETRPLGTAGALRNAARRIRSDSWVALNGDTFCRIPYKSMLMSHRRSGRLATVGIVNVTMLRNDPSPGAPGRRGAGVYVFSKKLLRRIPRGRAVSLESDVLPDLPEGFIGLFPIRQRMFDIGTPRRLAFFRRVMVSLRA